MLSNFTVNLKLSVLCDISVGRKIVFLFLSLNCGQLEYQSVVRIFAAPVQHCLGSAV